ncbi:hypothetical protein B296_00044840 [Ensete ventricosum]|uniref:Uncharacterized protein n=1 Tax=Ensete ventricosum TaxID=4639 RepID=A0A426YV20_ENSVE|nr:hypothetical protein B296_00044840 [Ensete ventricosum]
MSGDSELGSGSRLLEWWSSGQPLTPARRSGRVGSRRDPSDGQVSSVVGVVDHPYLATRLPLWLTLSSYASTTPAVLAVRDTSTGEGIGLTCVRSVVRLLGYRPYLCQVGRTTAGDSTLPVPSRPHDHWRPHTCVRPVYRVGLTISTDQLSEGVMM